MKVSVYWGGYNYATGEPETFTSLAAAAREFERRVHDSYYPCLEAGFWAEAHPFYDEWPTHEGRFTRNDRFVWKRVA